MQNINAELQQFKDDWIEAINLLASDFQLTHAQDPAVSIKAHFVDAKNDDENLINAVGIEAKLLVTNYSGLASKFDTVTDFSGTHYSVRAAHKVIINNTHIGWKMVLKS